MINVVLDTNVLMAAPIKKDGVNRAALRKVIDPSGIFRICYSSQMADECVEALRRHPISSRGLTSEAAALLPNAALLPASHSTDASSRCLSINFCFDQCRSFLSGVGAGAVVAGLSCSCSLRSFGLRGEMPSVAVGAAVGVEAGRAVFGARGDGFFGLAAEGVAVLRLAGFSTQGGVVLLVAPLPTRIFLGEDIVHAVCASEARFEFSDLLRYRLPFPAAHARSPLCAIGLSNEVRHGAALGYGRLHTVMFAQFDAL